MRENWFQISYITLLLLLCSIKIFSRPYYIRDRFQGQRTVCWMPRLNCAIVFSLILLNYFFSNFCQVYYRWLYDILLSSLLYLLSIEYRDQNCFFAFICNETDFSFAFTINTMYKFYKNSYFHMLKFGIQKKIPSMFNCLYNCLKH